MEITQPTSSTVKPAGRGELDEHGKLILSEDDLAQVANDNLGFTRQIVAADEKGETIVLADLYATVTSNPTTQSVNYNINIVNKEVVADNKELVQAEVDKFLAEIRKKTNAINLISL